MTVTLYAPDYLTPYIASLFAFSFVFLLVRFIRG